jgi:hypothetical protein
MAEGTTATPDMQPPFDEYTGDPLSLIEQRPILQIVDGDGTFLYVRSICGDKSDFPANNPRTRPYEFSYVFGWSEMLVMAVVHHVMRSVTFFRAAQCSTAKNLWLTKLL